MESLVVSLPLVLAAFAAGALFYAMRSDRRKREAASAAALIRKSPSMSVEGKRKMRERLLRAVCGIKREPSGLEQADGRRIRPGG